MNDPMTNLQSRTYTVLDNTMDFTTMTMTDGSGGTGSHTHGYYEYYDATSTTNATVSISAKNVRVGEQRLSDIIADIQRRLNLLVPNPALEAEWIELRELGEQYRALEAKILEMNKTFGIINR
jgi:hypothetical protein